MAKDEGPDKPKRPHLRVVADATKKPVATKAPAKPDRPRGGTRPGKGGQGNGHEPTAQTRMLVSLGLAAGMTHEQVCKAIGIGSINTLKLHYAEEIEDGGAKANLKVAGTMYSIATNPNHPKAVTAGIFWMKNRMGFNADTQRRDDDDDSSGEVEFTIGIGEKRGA